LGAIIQDILCLAWQDNNIILALSNIQTVDKAEDFREKVKKRLAKTSTNGQIIRRVFSDNPKKELQIPCFINNYNHYMRGVDVANQYKELYEIYRPTFKT
jgi:hypothetical protein